MFDTGIISLIVAGIVAAIQAFTFFDNRSLRKEQNLSTFAKADLVKTDLYAIRTAIDSQINRLFIMDEEKDKAFVNLKTEVNANSTDIAVIKERVARDKEFIDKLDEKLDKILNELMSRD